MRYIIDFHNIYYAIGDVQKVSEICFSYRQDRNR